jgi:hypothetical protein
MHAHNRTRAERTSCPSFADRKLEVVGIVGSHQLGLAQVNVGGIGAQAMHG